MRFKFGSRIMHLQKGQRTVVEATIVNNVQYDEPVSKVDNAAS